MKQWKILSLLFLIVLFSVGFSHHSRRSTTAYAARVAPSPTGHSPKLLWTPERQAAFDALETDPNWGVYVKRKADEPLTAGCWACASWPVIYYQMTGNISYAQKAWASIEPNVRTSPPTLPGDGSNGTRQGLMTQAWMYDWLKPALTTTQRQQFRDALIYWSKWTLGDVPEHTHGTRLNDSDEVVGHYFGVIFTALAIQAEDATGADALINNPDVGGLSATASNLTSTLRNALKKFAEMAEGGEWIESSDYNFNTFYLAMQGMAGIKTATGQNYFPEYAPVLRDTVLAYVTRISPDLKQVYQWGDEQHPHAIWFYYHYPYLQTLAFMVKDDPTLAGIVKGAMQSLREANSTDIFIREPNPYFFLFYDPSITPDAQWQSKTALRHYARGQGLAFSRTGWGNTESLFGAMSQPGKIFVDHQNLVASDFQLYRKGEWTITHPIAYAPTARAHNTMTFSGFGAAREARGPLAYESDTTYTYQVSGTAGNLGYTDYWNPPATFFHEWTRSLLYLPSQDKKSDTVIIYDRTNTEDPKTLFGWQDAASCTSIVGRYYCDDWNLIKNEPRKAWYIHTPVSPTVTDSAISWETPNGQRVRVTSLLPLQTAKRIVNEATENVHLANTIEAKERKYHVQITPVTVHQWDTFLHVAQAFDVDTHLESERIASTDAVEGTIVRRGSHNDTVAVFNATPGDKLVAQKNSNGNLVNDPDILNKITAFRLRKTSYSFSFTARTNTTDLFLADLDPQVTWHIQHNGQTRALAVSPQGLSRTTVTGTGQQSITIMANGQAPTPKADVRITKQVSSQTVRPGDTLTYTIQYTNMGTKTATNIVVEDQIPNNTTLIAGSATGNPQQTTTKLIWRIPRVEPSASGEVSFQVRVNQ